nr:uncharacterized protein LOC109153947 [Ipomoea batatas]
MQILYFHRLKWRGIAQPSTLPLIQHWTHENLKQRMPEEISAGDFGQGELDNSTYPISSSKVATKIERDQEMHEVFLLLKRDMSVITSVHMERVMKLKEQMKGKAPESSTQCQLSQDSQLFFRDSKVLEYVDQAVENFLAMKKLSEAMPSFDLLTPDEENDDQMANIAAENDGDGGIEDYMGNIAAKNYVDDEVDGDDGGWHIEDDCPFVSRFVNNNKQILSKVQIHELRILYYCFVHDKSFIEDVSENVFAFDGEYFIPWNDIATLNSNEMICTTVIDGWCLLMNRTQDSMKCYFFGIGFSIS